MPKVVVSSSDGGNAEVVGVVVADAGALTVADGTGYDLAVTKEVCTLRTRNMTATVIKATAMTTKTNRTVVACPLFWKPIARVPICSPPLTPLVTAKLTPGTL